MTWSNVMVERLNSGPVGENTGELQLHESRKKEISKRKSYMDQIYEQSVQITREIKEKLEIMQLSLDRAWNTRAVALKQAVDYEKFNDRAKQAEAWLDSKEAFLINEDLGNTLDRVDELVKINDQFKACIGKSVEVEEVYKFAAILGEQDHYEWESIKHRSQCVEERYATLLRKSQDRQKILSDSKNYQLYLTHIIEVSDWMNEKISIALDESCIDPEAKLKEHETFHAEVTANRQRVDAVKTEAEGLIEEGHYQSDNIKKRMGQMEIKWQAFMTASTDKTNRLTKTYQDDVTYNKIVAILLPWIDGLENQLKSEDHGNDLMAVIILLKTHQKLEACISSGKSEVEQLIDGVRKDKYMSKELFARWEVVQDRYGSLIELCYIRQDNLEKALLKP